MGEEQEMTSSGGEGREDGIRVGEPDVKPDQAAHVKGVRMGNSVESAHARAQLVLGRSPRAQRGAKGSAQRSTGINPGDREPIDPRMPRLSPS